MSVGELGLLVGTIASAASGRTYLPIIVFVGVVIPLEASALWWLPLVRVTTTQQKRKTRFAYALLGLVLIALGIAVVAQIMR